MTDDGGVVVLFREIDRGESLGQGADLVHFHENGIGHACKTPKLKRAGLSRGNSLPHLRGRVEFPISLTRFLVPPCKPPP